MKKGLLLGLAVVCIMAVMMGVVLAKPAGHHGGYHYIVTVPAGHFFATEDDPYPFGNFGNTLATVSTWGESWYSSIPLLPGNKVVEKLVLCATDNYDGHVHLGLYRTKTDGTHEEMAFVTSTNGSGVRCGWTTTISPDTIWGGHGAYLRVSITSAFQEFTAAQVYYYQP